MVPRFPWITPWIFEDLGETTWVTNPARSRAERGPVSSSCSNPSVANMATLSDPESLALVGFMNGDSSRGSSPSIVAWSGRLFHTVGALQAEGVIPVDEG